MTANRPGGGAVRVHRHFLFPATQMLVLVLHRELKASRTYRLNLTFDAAIEDELLGFFRSSYTLRGERRYSLPSLPAASGRVKMTPASLVC